MTHDRATRTLQVLLVAAFLVSIVHYVDNTVRFDDYAKDQGGPVSQVMIPLAWVVFTGFGLWGYLQYRRGEWTRAAVGLGVYSASGLVGLAHYTAGTPAEFDALQNTFIVLDVFLGASVLAFAFWLVLARHSEPAPG